jgi:hypothetical protein
VTGTVVGGAYPNPTRGQPINVWVEVSSHAVIQMTVFTTSFRKVVSHSFPMDQSGNIQWDLKDGFGHSVADGLYYLRVEAGSRGPGKVLKVLVLR